MNRRPLSPVALCLLMFAFLPTLLPAPPATAAEITREFTFATGDLYVGNLIGAIDVRQGAGDAFKVTVHLRGDDMTADSVQLVQESNALRIRCPLDEHQTYVYPALGRGSRTTFSIHDQDTTEKSWLRRTFRMLSGQRVTVRGSGNGMEMWADVTVEVPPGRTLTLRHGVGEVSSADLQADLDLESDVGGIRVERLKGDLRADTGSGDVTVVDVEGDLDVDTGSGRVEVAGLRCASLNIDTGSGSVSATGVAADEAMIDTGSGNVEFRLDRMGDGRFVVDTGSGGIEMELPADASANITADTGSGGIESEVPGARFEKLDDGSRRLVVGDGAAEVTLDTGSGSVVVSRK